MPSFCASILHHQDGGVAAVARRVGRIGLGQRGGGGADDGDGVARVEPDMSVGRRDLGRRNGLRGPVARRRAPGSGARHRPGGGIAPFAEDDVAVLDRRGGLARDGPGRGPGGRRHDPAMPRPRIHQPDAGRAHQGDDDDPVRPLRDQRRDRRRMARIQPEQHPCLVDRRLLRRVERPGLGAVGEQQHRRADPLHHPGDQRMQRLQGDHHRRWRSLCRRRRTSGERRAGERDAEQRDSGGNACKGLHVDVPNPCRSAPSAVRLSIRTVIL